MDIVKYLIEKGADVNAKDYYGVTALMYAALYGHLDIVKYLVEHGADVNAKNVNGDLALMYASNYGHTDIVKYLVEKGSDVNAKEYFRGVTALMFASREGHFDIVKYLIEHGADVNAKDENKLGWTALGWHQLCPSAVRCCAASVQWAFRAFSLTTAAVPKHSHSTLITAARTA